MTTTAEKAELSIVDRLKSVLKSGRATKDDLDTLETDLRAQRQALETTQHKLESELVLNDNPDLVQRVTSILVELRTIDRRIQAVQGERRQAARREWLDTFQKSVTEQREMDTQAASLKAEAKVLEKKASDLRRQASSLDSHGMATERATAWREIFPRHGIQINSEAALALLSEMQAELARIENEGLNHVVTD